MNGLFFDPPDGAQLDYEHQQAVTGTRDQDHEDWLTEADWEQKRYFDDFASGAAFAPVGKTGRDAATSYAPRGRGRGTFAHESPASCLEPTARASTTTASTRPTSSGAGGAS